KGGVALTSDALRAKALEADTGKEEYSIGTLPIVFWSLTAGMAVATVVSTVVARSLTKSAQTIGVQMGQKIADLKNELARLLGSINTLKQTKEVAQNAGISVASALKTNLTAQARVKVLEAVQTHFNEASSAEQAITKLENNATTTKASLENTQGVVDKANASANFAKFLSIGMAVITVIMTVVSTVMTMLDAAKFYDTEYTPIPKYIVEESDITAINAKGEQVMLKNQSAYYKVVRCNRTAGDSSITKKNFEVMGDANDLNGDIGTQWLSLYSIKYENGLPILADSLLYQINGDRVPDGYSTGIHEFGAKPARDINSAKYLFPEKTPEIKVHFKRDTSVQSAGAAGSLFTAGSLAIGGGVGLVVGAIFGGLVMSRRKKKTETAHE
ncbi:MAG: hypothetical protein J6P16_02220, partial [Eubacterium sp.]|nr:hypothetical protein [Eubacterium sp.]